MTGPQGPLEKTYVEIDANTKPLEEGVDKASEKTTKKLKTDFEKATAHIDATLKRAAKSIQKDLDKIAESGDVTAVEIEAALTHAAHAITDEYQQMAKHVEHAFDKVTASAVESAAASEAAVTLSENMSQVQDEVSGLAKGFQGLATKIGSSVAGMGVLGVAIALLIAPATALVAALAELAGLLAILPAAISTLIAAVLPLVVAFQNFGAALSAIVSGDPKKIAEALKKLSPAAREVAKEFQKLLPTFKSFQKFVQQQFFQPLIGDLTLVTKKLLPTLKIGFGQVASAIGEVVDKFANFLAKPAVVKEIGQIFATTSRIIRGFMDVGPAVFKGILDAAVALLPTLLKISNAFAGVLGDFGKWLSKVSQSGQLKKWFDDGLRVAKELWALLKSIGALFGTVFKSLAPSGEDFLTTLTDIVNKLNDFFKSAEGQKALQNAADYVKSFGNALKTTADLIIKFDKFGTNLVETIKNIVHWAGSVYDAFWGGVIKAFSAVGTAVVGVGKWLATLPGIIGNWLSKLPGIVGGFFKSMGDAALFQIGVWIGLIIAAVTKLPGMIINGVKALPGLLANFFTTAWDKAKSISSTALDAIVDFVKKLPGRVVSFAKSAIAAVGGFFSRVFNDGKDKAKNAIDAIIGFVKNLPSKLGAFVKNVGSGIANVIKDMLNHAIRKINEGIAKVDDYIPGDLPRIPQLAKGGVVKASPGGTLVNVGEGGKDEVVGPLDDLRKFFGDGGDGGSGMTITFSPGAVVVQFEGATPTQSEARAVGETVGHSIADTLARRNARTNVRTL